MSRGRLQLILWLLFAPFFGIFSLFGGRLGLREFLSRLFTSGPKAGVGLGLTACLTGALLSVFLLQTELLASVKNRVKGIVAPWARVSAPSDTTSLGVSLASARLEDVPALFTFYFMVYLAPIVIAQQIAGRVMTEMTADLASMTASGELETMRVSGVDPIMLTYAPRAAALMVAVPGLFLICVWSGIAGAGVSTKAITGMSFTSFLNSALYTDAFQNDWTHILARAFIAVWATAAIGGYYGLRPGRARKRENIGKAALNSLFVASIANLMINLFFWILA